MDLDTVAKFYKKRREDRGVVISARKLELVSSISRNIEKEWSVLDFGCGDGFITTCMQNYCEKIVGVDLDVSMAYRVFKGVEFFDSRKEGSKYLHKKYDAVLCLDVIEHVEPNELIALIEDISKLCDKRIFISFPANKVDSQIIENEIPEKLVRDLLTINGFINVFTEYNHITDSYIVKGYRS
jgi:2-polyprenyl-3-methyl-5-hydroxy-6-metoxy-1,4-benzoquinol methylase